MWVVLDERSYKTWVHEYLSVQKPTVPDFTASRLCVGPNTALWPKVRPEIPSCVGHTYRVSGGLSSCKHLY